MSIIRGESHRLHLYMHGNTGADACCLAVYPPLAHFLCAFFAILYTPKHIPRGVHACGNLYRSHCAASADAVANSVAAATAGTTTFLSFSLFRCVSRLLLSCHVLKHPFVRICLLPGQKNSITLCANLSSAFSNTILPIDEVSRDSSRHSLQVHWRARSGLRIAVLALLPDAHRWDRRLDIGIDRRVAVVRGSCFASITAQPTNPAYIHTHAKNNGFINWTSTLEFISDVGWQVSGGFSNSWGHYKMNLFYWPHWQQSDLLHLPGLMSLPLFVNSNKK